MVQYLGIAVRPPSWGIAGAAIGSEPCLAPTTLIRKALSFCEITSTFIANVRHASLIAGAIQVRYMDVLVLINAGRYDGVSGRPIGVIFRNVGVANALSTLTAAANGLGVWAALRTDWVAYRADRTLSGLTAGASIFPPSTGWLDSRGISSHALRAVNGTWVAITLC